MKSTRYTESGFGIIAVIVVIVVGVLGYFVWNGYGKQAVLDITTKPERNACEKTNDQDICKFVTTWGKSGDKYHITVSDSSMGIVSDVDGDNYHTTTSSGGTTITDAIKIGSNLYSKNQEDGTWYKQAAKPTDSKPAGTSFDVPSTDAGSNIKYVNLGKQPCDSLTCFVYQLSTNAGDRTTSMELYFDDKDYKLRKLDMGAFAYSYTYSDSISIKEPSPVKDVATKR